ncbi:hypothetical protein RDABS01_038276 [Bienertia sinuspersici]
MNLRLRQLLSKQSLTKIRRITSSSSSAIVVPHINNHNHNHPKSLIVKTPSFLNTQIKNFHSSLQRNQSLSTASATTIDDEDEDEDVAAMNEFLSRFVYIMRGNLNETYPHCDKPTIDAMLTMIVDKLVSEMEKGGNLEENLVNGNVDFSDDLWKTVLEVSNSVFQEMEREKKKEKMKKFLQSEEVKSMARFASEVGVRGDMLHELRFKWAREAMEKAEFYERLEACGEAAMAKAEAEAEAEVKVEEGESGVDANDVGGLPKRHGKIKYKLYGLDLSGLQWKEVADRIHDAEGVISDQEPKPITGKCKLVNEKILGLGLNDDFDTVISPLLDEWKELLQPNRVDWMFLLEKFREKDTSLYLKMAEHVLDEPSFEANTTDYSKLIEVHAKENRLEDIERILKKMSERGVPRDILTLTALLHMYSKANNLEQAEAVYQELNSLGFKPDMELYNAMIMAYVNGGNPKLGEKLLREMELRDIKPTEEIYMSVLRAFAKHGDITGAQRTVTNMQFVGFQQTAESCTCLIEACGKSGNPDDARKYFNEMMNLGFKPDDRCTSLMISAYEKKNKLELAIHLLLQLEKGGFEPGVSTYSVLIDWLGKLKLVDEAEQMLTKMAQLGEAPPFKLQVSLCDMYARAGNEKKTLQALGILEAKKELLDYQDFERIITALLNSGLVQDAQRIQKVMEAQGFTPSESLNIKLMTTQAFRGNSGAGSRRPRVR